MDKVIHYKYAFGTTEQLRKGDLDSMPTAKTLAGLELTPSREDILIPKFVGVYQKDKIILQTEEEQYLSEPIKSLMGQIETLTESMSNISLLDRTGSGEKINPYLIHIVYNPEELWNPGLVRQCIGDEFGRIAISSTEKIPDFYEKQTVVLNSIVDEGQEMSVEGMSREDIFKELGPQIDDISEQLNIFGLTRLEYILFKTIQKARSPKQIIHDTLSIKLFQSMDEKDLIKTFK